MRGMRRFDRERLCRLVDDPVRVICRGLDTIRVSCCGSDEVGFGSLDRMHRPKTDLQPGGRVLLIGHPTVSVRAIDSILRREGFCACERKIVLPGNTDRRSEGRGCCTGTDAQIFLCDQWRAKRAHTRASQRQRLDRTVWIEVNLFDKDLPTG